MGSSKLFKQEKIGKLLLRFSIPIIIAFFISELYSMVDTVFVGNYVGPLGIGALVLVFPLQRILYAISILISTGSSNTFSKELGKENLEKSALSSYFSRQSRISFKATSLFSTVFGE